MAYGIAPDLVVLGGGLCSPDGREKLQLADGSTGDVTYPDAGFLKFSGGGQIKVQPGGNLCVNSSGVQALKVDTAGNTEVVLDLTVTGNNISGTGGVCLTFDGLNGVTTGDYLTTGGKLTVNAASDVSFAGVDYTWPGADGSSGQILSTNGSGALSWATDASGSSGYEVDTTVRTASGNVTASDASKTILIDSSSAPVVLTLAAASGFTNGDVIVIKNVGSSTSGIQLTNTSTDKVDGTTRTAYPVITTKDASVNLVCDGAANFYVF